jgi:hypothetical protein
MYAEVVTSINASHKMIVRMAQERKMPEVCIAEDDLMFPASNGWQWFLQNKPESFDIYAAANYLPFEKEKTNGSVKVDCIVGFHLYIVSEKYYNTFLDTNDKDHIDTAQKGELYVCYPFAALQRPGFSANNKAMTNYNAILQESDIYK